jgi:DNA-binding transcriptional LysR family regulator
MPPFEALRAFDAVARLGGVRKAARELRRNHAVVSRHLRTIEDWTGTKLVKRTPAGTVLTEQGSSYHQRIAVAIDAIANATIDLMKQGDNSSINIWCMPGFAFHWLVTRLTSYETSNPDIDISLRPSEHRPDFDRQEADIDIRFSQNYGRRLNLSHNLRSVEIASPPIIIVASPEYLASAPKAETPRDLLKHQLIHEQDYEDWSVWLQTHGLDSDFSLSGLRLFNGHLTLEAARSGRGIALTNHFVAYNDLKDGALVEIGGTKQPFEHLSLGSYLFIARRDRWNVRPIRRFREWLLDEIIKEQPTTGNTI